MSSQEIHSANSHAPYNRPNQKWTCGHSRQGCPTCPLGPDAKGNCRASGQCHPILREDRYHCTRSASLGGKCQQGPLPDGTCACIIPPCNPSLSLRAFRGRICIAAAVITIALIVFLLNGPNSEHHKSAGPLTVHHATTIASCIDCHSGTDANTALSADLFLVHERALANSQKCLECHDLGPTPLNPHSLPTTQLAELTLNTSSNTTHENELACVSCHTEHKGLDFDIKAMNDAQCQKCHQNQFHDFATDHPPFEHYPYNRRTRIIFDHGSHLLDHFSKPKFQEHAPNSCQSCHQLDAAGAYMQTKQFEVTCASCHSDQIEGAGRAGALGIAFLRLPGIDIETLQAKGYPVGDWPEHAEGDLTAFMHAILQQDTEINKHLNTLEKVDTLDLREATPEELEAATGLLWAVKSLFLDILTGDQRVLSNRILSNHLNPKPHGSTPHLSAQMPFDTIKAVQSAWFPNLLSEVPQYKQGSFTPSQNEPQILEASALQPHTTTDNSSLFSSDDDAQLFNTSESDDLLFEEDESEGMLLFDEEDENELSLEDDDGLLASDSSDEDLLLGDDDLNVSSLDTESLKTAEQPTAPIQLKAPEIWSSEGGWYRSDNYYTLYYRPSGHADQFISGWINQTAPHTHQNSILKDIFEQLSADKSPGLCMKCHSIDTASDGSKRVNWTAQAPTVEQRSFTKFRHAPHFNRLENRGCIECHILEPKNDYASSFLNNQAPHKFSSNFADMNEALCATCHNKKTASTDCLHCHNYHIGTSAPKLTADSLATMLKDRKKSTK